MAIRALVPGSTVTLECALIDEEVPANNPVTGQTIIASVRRLSDDKWWDFVASEWDTVAGGYANLGAEHKQTLTDELDGSYSYAWNQQTADAGVVREYRVYYRVTSAGGWLNVVADDRLQFQGPTALVTQETHARAAYGVAADTSANTIKVYDGPDPASANLLYTLTRTQVGNVFKYVRT